MTPALRALAGAALLALSATAALAAASQAPVDYRPDPALRTASRGELERRIGRACQATQAKLASQAEASFAGPCGCYAQRTLRSLDASELASYRETGFFSDGARAKAVAALDACRLQRPI